jgi:hypothetical protein
MLCVSGFSVKMLEALKLSRFYDITVVGTTGLLIKIMHMLPEIPEIRLN